MKKVFKLILLSLLLAIIVYIAFLFLFKPSNDRDWKTPKEILAYADINGNEITIYNIRNFNYRSNDDYDINYYDKKFDLNKLQSVDFILEPFSKFSGLAHTFLSFGFEDNEYVSISVETRNEKDEEYSIIKGLFNQYEIMYIVADEKDVVKLRSNYRNDKVYIYPAKTTKEKKQALFLNMINRLNKLKDQPEFYNTLTNTCTTNIVRHINTISPKKIPFSYKVLLPGYAAELAFDLGLIDTDLTLKEAMDMFLINDRALKYADDPDFSTKIRTIE
ncbi:DUF4105 domain-containing protein [Candidatus Falkowbacteria bacterium]|uniref:Lnb N-terminal periplasmic domain-containing protein n=1 Tax=Candidatus Buchananbacteria bacterium CG10_big_fil_rev_8_21_14_0_10_33_19 TaxID=1974525 RepID=A0A2H0W548_9BACT|nr:DUF4105 domain-containing protein [Candidatus Falkowbacteria bacterium]PIS05711.1 MAG: hypothetical protein COT80_02985 [Candidatus Buchananbacteria bacterium CG10_big_fil_rev_8_21_14_0_10_33_19]